MITYELEFSEKAWKEWKKLDSALRDRLRGLENAYKIKLRSAGFRLVYRVTNEVLVVTVIAVGKRERGEIYDKAASR